MPSPQDSDARKFYRAAFQRREDARFLLHYHRNTGAVYLAGYAVECLLKALILSQVSRSKRPKVMKSFRGSQAHDYDWLRSIYRHHKGPQFRTEVLRAFDAVGEWRTNIRYELGMMDDKYANRLLKALNLLIDSIDERLGS